MVKIKFLCVVTLGIIMTGCSSSPVKGTFLSSGEKNIWISDPSNLEISYCMSNADTSKPEPVCYPARFADLSEARRHTNSPRKAVSKESTNDSANDAKAADESKPAN